MLLKRNVVGVDANPLAWLDFPQQRRRDCKTVTRIHFSAYQRAFHLANEFATDEYPTLFPAAKFVSKAPRPQNEAIEFWFESFITERTGRDLSWCRKLPAESARKHCLGIFFGNRR